MCGNRIKDCAAAGGAPWPPAARKIRGVRLREPAGLSARGTGCPGTEQRMRSQVSGLRGHPRVTIRRIKGLPVNGRHSLWVVCQ